MGDHSRFLIAFIDIILPMILGMWLRRRGLAPAFIRSFNRVNVVGVTTALSVLSFWSIHLTPLLLWLPLSIFPICFIPCAWFFLFERRRFSDPRETGSYLICMMMGNIGTVSALCGYVLFGEKGFAYVQMIAVPQIIVFVLFAFPAAQYYRALWDGGDQKPLFQVKDMLLTWNQLPVAGVAAGMLLSGFDVPRPDEAKWAFSALIHIGAWMGMISVGYGINLRRAMAYAGRMTRLAAVRFFLAPVFLWGMTRLMTDDQEILVSILLAASAPTAVFSVMAAQLYKVSVDLAEAAFLTSTIAYLFLIYPALYWYVAHGGTF